MPTHRIQIECRRCGECCRKGGPAFHLEDRGLIETGQIAAKFLFTIRKGEPAYNNVTGFLIPSPSDIIKIKGKKESWSCLFFEEPYADCRIYEYRPVECRILKCWEPAALERMYDKNRLTRKDLLQEIKGLWDIVEEHSVKCAYETIRAVLLEDGKKKTAGYSKKLNEMIFYESELRALTVEKAKLDPELLDFIFGRPLSETLSNMIRMR
ncbi:MAG: YkgJ family cysteine cluster protein [Thermodesulfobacteriota bacterium]